MLTDNGAVFTGRYRSHGRVALEVTLHARGVVFSHSRTYHPQTCGKVERFHQTLKKWLAHQPPTVRTADLQTQLDRFSDYYNTVRPHRALRRHTPAEAYTARPKATPTGVPLADGHFRIRHDKIDSNGKLTLRHNSRLHHTSDSAPPRRHTRPRLGPRPARPGAHQPRRAPPRPDPRPRPGLPATGPNVNDVAGHL